MANTLRSRMIRLAGSMPKGSQERTALLDVLTASAPPMPRLSKQDVLEQVSIYWSPRYQKLEPSMMGNSMAKEVEPLVMTSLLGAASTEFIQGKWSLGKLHEWERLVVDTIASPARAGGLAKNVGHHLTDSTSGFQQWSQVFDPRYAYGLKELQKYAKTIRADGGKTFPQEQTVILAAWLEEYVQERINFGKKLKANIERSASPIVKNLVGLAAQGVPPEQW